MMLKLYDFRAIRTSVGGFPRPLIDLSQRNFAKLFDEALGYSLEPPFDPYYSTTNYLLASYVIPYMGMVGYVGANPNINGYVAKRVIVIYYYSSANQKHTYHSFSVLSSY